MVPTQIGAWRRWLLEAAPDLFADRRRKRGLGVNDEELYEQIGRLITAGFAANGQRDVVR